MDSRTIPAAQKRVSPPAVEEQKIKVLWTALQVADKQQEKRGIEFGQAMYEYREKHSAQGRRTDLVTSVTKSETFEEFCDRLHIVRMTAYRWITRYEEIKGERPTKPKMTYVPKPIEIAPDPTPDPSPRKGMTIVERDNQQLRDFTHRLTSVTSALKTLIANDAAECSEYHNMVKAAKVLAKVIEKL